MAAEKNNTTLNVPNLRFPEFSGEWEIVRLGDVCKFFSGGTPSSTNKDFYDGDIPFIRSGEIHSSSTELYISEAGLNSSSAKIIEQGDLLLALYGATSGDIAISKIKGAINQAILCIRTNHDNFFLKSCWEKHRRKLLQTYLQGGQGNLSADIVKSIKISFPSCLEQKKISGLLALIEERIETQKKIIEKYESLIRGLCEKLTRHGDANKSINECLECHSSTLQESEVLDTGRYPVYGAIGVCGYTDTPDVSGEGILIIKDGASVGVTYFADGCYSSIGTLNRLTAKQGINLRYVYYCLKVMNFAPYKTGLAIPHIYFKDYGKHKRWCPSFEQQSRIADALINIDNKIHVEKLLLEQLNSQKRYMLNQLFI